MRPRIVLLERNAFDPGDNPIDSILELGNATWHNRTGQFDEALVIERTRDAEILVINKVRITAEILRALPQLKLITVTATGYDSIDTQAAQDRGVVVCNVPEYSTDSVAQHVFALLLSICRQPALHDAQVRAGVWKERDEFCFWSTPQIDLTEKTMGIVGLGRIGTRVAQLAAAFGMNVVAHSRRMDVHPSFPGFRWLALDELFAASDVVTLHCPLNEDTQGLAHAARFQRMRSGSIFINTSRGGLVIESDLAEALASGRPAAAAIDTVSREPIEETNPLLSAPNCLLTPHLAWASLAARQRLVVETASNISAFIAGTPRNVVA